MCWKLLLLLHAIQLVHVNSTSSNQCIFSNESSPWTNGELVDWLRSRELRRIARNLSRYLAIRKNCVAQQDAPEDWELCSLGANSEKKTMLHCSRGTITALLVSNMRVARALLSRSVAVIPPHRWARLGVAQAAIVLLTRLKEAGRPINTAFLGAWVSFAERAKQAKQIVSKESLHAIYDAVVEAAGSPSLDAGITLPALKALLYRHEYGTSRWGRALEYMEVDAVEGGTTTQSTRTPLMMSDSIIVLCKRALQWLHRNAGAAVANPERPENYVEMSYPVRALLGVFQNLLFSYDLADSQQVQHTLSLFDKERCPKYTLPVVEYLDGIDFSKANVFEFGVGGSTLWWLKRCKTITAVDTSVEWIKKVEEDAAINQDRVQLLHRSASSAPWSINDKNVRQKNFDVILIDGAFSRYDSARSAVEHLAPGGIILLDDADWYGRTSKFLRSQNLIQVDFHGMKPGDGAAWRATSLFLHREFTPEPRPGMALPMVSRGGIALGSSWDRP
jgi:hypothetical protein